MTISVMKISIARTDAAGGPDPLVYSGVKDGGDLGIVAFQAPAHLNLVSYAPPSGERNGQEAISKALQHAQIVYDWMCDTADAESVMQAAYRETCAALDQFPHYIVTTQIGDAAPETWRADPGSVTPPARTWVDLEHPNALVIAVTIPVFPIPGSA